jgi:hypothetical protein
MPVRVIESAITLRVPVGLKVGDAVVGLKVGDQLGEDDGPGLGLELGVNVGTGVGARLGEGVGPALSVGAGVSDVGVAVVGGSVGIGVGV